MHAPKTSAEHAYLSDEVDRHTLTPESTRTTYTVNVVLAIDGEIIVDHQ